MPRVRREATPVASIMHVCRAPRMTALAFGTSQALALGVPEVPAVFVGVLELVRRDDRHEDQLIRA